MSQRKFKVGDKVKCKCQSLYGRECLYPDEIYTVKELTFVFLGLDTDGVDGNTIRVSGKCHSYAIDYHFIENDFELANPTIEQIYNNVPFV
jgi:hypothetical protein